MGKYTGPINVGMCFLWEPFKPHATEHIKVCRHDGFHIGFRSWVSTTNLTGDYTSQLMWYDVDVFRQAVMLVEDEKDEEE